MAKFANIKLELQKITHFAHVQTLKKEMKHLTDEIRKRGESEFSQLEKGVRQVRARVQKLQKQIEKEVAKVRKQVKSKAKPKAAKAAVKKTASKAKASVKKTVRKTTKKTARKA